MTNVDAKKAGERSESAGDDGKSQPIPLSDIRHRVDDDDAMAIDESVQVGSFYISFHLPLTSRPFL